VPCVHVGLGMDAPARPYFSGSWEFISPTSQAWLMICSGQVASRSYSHATGRISFSAKSCASSRMFRCCSVSVKSSIFGGGCFYVGREGFESVLCQPRT
jgi:hypothetical protein